MNLCRSCDVDFGSVAAFDAHRVGVHAYTSTEGLRMDPPKEDGRRCLRGSELEQEVNKDGSKVFTLNNRGTWSLTASLGAARSLNEVDDEVPQEG